MRAFGAALLLGAILLVGGCGGSSDDPKSGDDGRLSTAEIAKELRADETDGARTFTDEAADCLAKALHDSKMSTKGIRDFLEGGKTFTDADTDAFRDVLPSLATCSAPTPGTS